MSNEQFSDKIITQSKSLFVSAGHDENDPGAVGNGYTEADIVLAFRDALCDELDKLSIAYQRDGREGENLPLRTAIGIAKKYDLAVEFHCNAAANASATGTETLSHPDDYPLGSELCKVISDTLGIANRGPDGYMSRQHSRFGFIRDGGGIIVELFFISNVEDVSAYRRSMSLLPGAVARVLADYVAPLDNYGGESG